MLVPENVLGKFKLNYSRLFSESQFPQITIETRNNLPVLYLNKRYLHTITNQDRVDRETLQERAKKIKNYY